MTRKLSRQDLQHFTALGLRAQIEHHEQELTRLRTFERSLFERGRRSLRRAGMDSVEDAAQVLARATQPPPKKRTMSKAHRLAVSKAQKRRWRQQKAAAKESR